MVAAVLSPPALPDVLSPPAPSGHGDAPADGPRRRRGPLALIAAWRRQPPTARAIALILVALIHLILLLALLFAARTPPKPGEPGVTVARLIPLAHPAAPKPTSKPVPQHKSSATKAPIPIVKQPPIEKAPPALFKTEMMEAIDITKLPSHKGEQAATATADAGSGGTTSGEGPYGAPVASGPHGEVLYAADWYREPTDAEIKPYLPKHLPPVADALIMCKTIDHFGVEDCQELGESPIGTGLSRAIRQAAWQFKVKPVRLGQKFEVGTWVRIRFTITTHEVRADG